MKKRTRRYTRKVFTGKKILLMLFSLIAGLVGYDYYDAGNLERTGFVLERTGESLLQLKGHLEDAGKRAEYLLRKQLFYGTSDYDSLDAIPEYSGKIYVTLNDNIPEFNEEQRKRNGYEYYSELDYLGRCGYAEANITPAMMPTEERGPIGSVRPSGWHTVKYEGIDGNYLYNRCHLIGYQLTGENANVKNLITGTRYLNVEGMLPWENRIADYVRKTGDTVMYRVTPYFEGEDLLAKGVVMEAESIGSKEIQFHIFVYNIQPGIGIDYADGNSWKNK